MKYYYLIRCNEDIDYAVCFSNKKEMMRYAKDNLILAWYYTTNKRDIPPRITRILGNGICKDYTVKDSTFVIKNSLKDRRL